MRLFACCVLAGVAAWVRQDYRRFKRELALSLQGTKWARR